MHAKLSTRESLKRLNILPESGVRNALYQAALSELDLTVIDYQTIRDIMEMSYIKNDPAIEAAIIALFVARNEGSLCVKIDVPSLTRRLPEFIGRDEIIETFIKNLRSGVYDNMLVGHDESTYKPLILSGENLYFQRYLRDESILRDTLHEWLNESKEVKQIDIDDIRGVVTAVIAKPSVDVNGTRIDLNPEQKLALVIALLQSFTVITGGPGTGKTSIIMAILRCLIELNIPIERIALTAPTGRAAKRMSESMQMQLANLPDRTPAEDEISKLSGQTIHRLLKYSPSRNTFSYNADNQLALDVVVVDEVSMIDTSLMSRLLEAIPPTTKLIMLGDTEQLPSVDAGTVLADLVPSNQTPTFSEKIIKAVQTVLSDAPVIPFTPTPTLLTDRIVRLVRSHRSGPEIMAMAEIVNNFSANRDTELFNLLTTDNQFCKWEDSINEKPTNWWQRLNDWADYYYGDKRYTDAIQNYHLPDSLTVSYDKELTYILNRLTMAKILTVIHNSQYGCDNINAYLSDRIRHHLNPDSHGKYFAGMHIMVTKNDYTLDLFNGDTGIVLHDTANGYRAAFPRGIDVLIIPLDMLPEHTLAFAVTIHKAQGSEFDNVMLVLPNSDSSKINRLMTREIIYTGITRAKKTITIHSSRESLKQACIARVERDSGMMLWD